MNLYAIHGFLGLHSDWEQVLPRTPGLQIRAVDLWADITQCRATDASDSLAAWTKYFIARTESEGPAGAPRILLGYSLGARLALHAVLAAPHLFKGVILVSVHPGLQSASEQSERLRQDQKWGAAFLERPWSEVIRAWNDQPVLKSETELPRAESDFERDKLARSLDVWSLGRQRDLRAEIARLQIPHLFVCGAGDTKFSGLTQALELNSFGTKCQVPGAGHRVPWDQPQEFARRIEQFIEGLSRN